jgi:cation diffusion facilitator CzcD-associated flavoprotein CzcO
MSNTPQMQPLDVLVIGAGFSGICAGIKLLERGISNFRIYEKSQGIGGTWYDNSYPGAACDVPSHFYCYSFEPNPNWSRVYSPQAEIQTYIEHCADKYKIRPYIENGAKITEMRLDEARGIWQVTFANGEVVEARHIINGYGGLHKPSVPNFAGKDSFTGPTMHTAEWDHSVEFGNKRVAVIGSAASAIQIIPELTKIVEKLTIFQRTPNYIAPRGDRSYTAAEKQRFARWPLLQRLYRWFLYKRMDLILYPITKKGSKAGKIGREKVMQHMRASVKNPDLHELLEPNFEMGCKRILLSDDLFRSLNRDNTVLESNAIDQIEPTGVRCKDGTLHDVDIIVFATGFDIDGHMRSIDIYGSDGQSLVDTWVKGPEGYCGSCVAGFPNYWMVTGPNTGVGTTSVVYMIEQSIQFITRMIESAGTGNMISVKQSAQDEFNKGIQSALDKSVWASGCDSYYITETGKITTLYPHNAAAFRKQLHGAGIQDFDVVTPMAGADHAQVA